MSQVSIIDIEGAHPAIPTQFDANVGFAIPIANVLEILGEVVAAGVNPFQTTGSGNTITAQVQISQAIAASNALNIGLAAFDSSDFTVDANGFVSLVNDGPFVESVSGTANRITSTGGVNPVIDIAANYVGQTSITTLGTITTGTWQATTIGTIYGGTGLTSYTTGDILYASAANTLAKLPIGTAGQVLTVSGGIVAWATNASTDLHTAKFIVGDLTNGANYATIAAAIAAASSGDTVFIQTGTYTENLTLKAGVNLTAFVCDGSATSNSSTISTNVTIVGKLTCSFTGRVAITGIQLKTNSDYAIECTTANAQLALFYCYLNCSNFSGIHLTGSSYISVYFCNGDLGTTGIAYFVQTSGTLNFTYGNFTNVGGSTTASTISGVAVGFSYTFFGNAITTSSSALINSQSSVFSGAIILAGTGSITDQNSTFTGNAASAITVGAGCSGLLAESVISSSNTNSITGAGSLTYGGLTFIGSSSQINVTTQVLYNQGPSKTIGSSNSGATNTLLVTNSSDTASSSALISASVGGTSSADPYYSAVITGGQTWTWGADNSDSDAFVVSANAALGTTNVMRVATGGAITFPLQASFLTGLGTGDSNVTGNGATYTLGSGNALTEAFDVGGNISTAGVFTAAVTSKWDMKSCIFVVGCTIASSYILSFVASNRTLVRSDTRTAAPANYGFGFSTLLDFDAGDTCTVTLNIFGEAGDTDDVQGVVGNTWFSGIQVS